MDKINSIKGKLTSRLLIGFFIIYAVLGGAFYKIVAVALTDQLDNELISWVNNISEMFDFEEPEIDNEFQGTVFDDNDVFGGRKYYQVWTNDKETFARSPSLKNSKLPFFDVALYSYRFENIKLPRDTNGRAVVFSFINSRIDEDSIDEANLQKLENFIEKMEEKENTNLIIDTDKRKYHDFLKLDYQVFKA
ncbi:hypothetical protein QUF76_10670 [Desulfobacterales bacterium HSG16]|nr:hypothetical protein [Desulfobacterales bacterium HSG16]